jgi:ribonucleotide monophosphatase NagD (HAD superfamily)
VLNHAFRRVIDGAELIALQRRTAYWKRADGLSLDVGPFVAAIEYATGGDAYVVGKPAKGFFEPPIHSRSAPLGHRSTELAQDGFRMAVLMAVGQSAPGG